MALIMAPSQREREPFEASVLNSLSLSERVGVRAAGRAYLFLWPFSGESGSDLFSLLVVE